jgi:GTP cyclohydrolase I
MVSKKNRIEKLLLDIINTFLMLAAISYKRKRLLYTPRRAAKIYGF